MLTPVPRCQLAGFEESFSPLLGMYPFLLVQTYESHVMICDAFHIWPPLAPGSAPNGYTLLVMTYGGKSCLLLWWLAPNLTKQLQASQHTRLFQGQFIYRNNTDSRLNMPVVLGDYNILCGLLVSSWLQNGDVLCFLWGTNWIHICYVEESRPPLWF
jgi:hypothetical protein